MINLDSTVLWTIVLCQQLWFLPSISFCFLLCWFSNRWGTIPRYIWYPPQQGVGIEGTSMDKHPTEVNNNPFNSHFLKDFVQLAPEKKTLSSILVGTIQYFHPQNHSHSSFRCWDAMDHRKWTLILSKSHKDIEWVTLAYQLSWMLNGAFLELSMPVSQKLVMDSSPEKTVIWHWW